MSDPERARRSFLPVLDDDSLPDEVVPRFNIAPTQPALIIRNRDERALEHCRWGLVPSWAKDVSIGGRMINARSETLAEKASFRDALHKRRCLVPADGFYEWKKQGKHKQAHFIHRDDRTPFAFAGLWDRWRDRADPDGPWIVSFTIVTSAPHPVVAELHDRMPVVVEPDDWERWLAREPLPIDALSDILQPSSASDWVADPVGDYVNRVDHEGPACLELGPVQQSLF